jgi:hypothetical protein
MSSNKKSKRKVNKPSSSWACSKNPFLIALQSIGGFMLNINKLPGFVKVIVADVVQKASKPAVSSIFYSIALI